MERPVLDYKIIAKTMSHLTASAAWLFWEIMENHDVKTNVAEVMPATPNERVKITRGYTELLGKNIIVRTDRSLYMVNPIILVPEEDRIKGANLFWMKYIKAAQAKRELHN